MHRLLIAVCLTTLATRVFAFEGKIEIEVTRGGESTPLLYTLNQNSLRIEASGGSAPNPINIIDLKSNSTTIVYPHNRSFVRLKPVTDTAAPQMPPGIPTPPPGIGAQPNKSAAGAPPMPPMPAGVGPQPDKMPPGMPPIPTPSMGLPPGVGPQPGAPGVGATGAPGNSSMPNMPGVPGTMAHMPMMPPMPMEKLELQATGKKDKILGYECEQFELKQRGEIMEIWATNQLLPFQSYLHNEPHRFGPRMLEEQWPALLTAKKLFPLRVSLRFDMGPNQSPAPERFHFEVKTIKQEKISDEKLFQPPEGYFEVPPLPF